MSRFIVLFIFLFTSTVSHAVQYDNEAQELIDVYLKSPAKTGDLSDLDEQTELGRIYGAVNKLNKEDYRKTIEFLRDNWNINTTNAQRLFIQLQDDWVTRFGVKLLESDISKKYVDRTYGLAAGASIMALNMLRPLISLRRNPLKALTFNWGSLANGAPIATTFASSYLLQNLNKTEAAKDLMKRMPPSPAEIMGFPMTMPNEETDTLADYELSQLYTIALSLGLTGFASDLLMVKNFASGVKTAGSTAGRVVIVLTLAAAAGFAAETAIDIGVQSVRFNKLASDLKFSIDQLNKMKPDDPNAQLAAQNIYAKTINLAQFELLPYIKAYAENKPLIEQLQAKIASSVVPKDGLWHDSWYKDSVEADLYLANKDIRDGVLTSMRNKECQTEVEQYFKLSARVSRNPQDKRAGIGLTHLTHYLVKQFSEGKFCGGYMQGHPLNLFLSASLYLKNFSDKITWPQTNELDKKLAQFAGIYVYALQTELVSPHERKINDKEALSPSWSIERQEWVQRHLRKRQAQ